jgi:hypothetical protein
MSQAKNKGGLRKIHEKNSEILILILPLSSFLILFTSNSHIHMITNGYPIFNLLLGLKVRKSPEKLVVNPSSEIEHMFAL